MRDDRPRRCVRLSQRPKRLKSGSVTAVAKCVGVDGIWANLAEPAAAGATARAKRAVRSGSKPIRMLSQRYHTAGKHQHADGPDEHREIPFIRHAEDEANYVPNRADSSANGSADVLAVHMREYGRQLARAAADDSCFMSDGGNVSMA